MNDALLVRERERVEDAGDDRDRFGDRRGAARRDPSPQRFALHPRHHEERRSTGGGAIVDHPHDARVRERPTDPKLGLEPTDHGRVVDQLGPELLDGEHAGMALAHGPVHHAHSSHPGELGQHILRDRHDQGMST